VSFEDKELGISLTAPAGWFFYKSPSPATYRFSLHILPPELKAWAVLTGGQMPSGTKSARQVAEGDVGVLKDYFKGYTVRADSWAEPEISGMPAASCIADYQEKGKEMVEYRTYLLGKSTVYWFVFRIEKDAFEAAKHELDSVVKSFKAEDEPGGRDAEAEKTPSELH
jgi:hypothetical protein